MFEVAVAESHKQVDASAGAIVRLDPDDADQVRAAAALHAQLLGGSPIPRLGFLFMTRFFYSRLVKDGLIHCLLYRAGAQYVGFVSFTDKPFTFMDEGKRRHLLRLVCILGLAVLVKPARLRILLETLQGARRKQAQEHTEGIGEMLSFGVLEDFATTRGGPQALRIPNLLFDAGIEFFRKRGFRSIQWTVDKDNLAALIFYRSYGAKIEKTADAWPGDYRVVLEL